ncbi:MAG: prepilin-type N-terminal cleavage/methylation domain-containing protein [Verrucomicrobiia bacterium]
MNPLRPSPQRVGFTLLELLAVLIILSLLISLVVPSMGKVRARVDTIVCKNNLRSIWLGIQQAVDDNGGFYPNIEPDPENPIYLPEENALSLAETLAPYGVGERTLRCPADAGAQDFFSRKGTSYEWRPFVDGEPAASPQIYFRRGVMIPSPNRLRLIMDYTPVHQGRANRLFADGSVR